MTSLISSISWIPRGAAAQNPQKYSVDEQELERISQLAKGQLEGAKIELELAKLIAGDGDEDASGSEGGGERGDGDEEGEWEDEEEEAAMDVEGDNDEEMEDAATLAAQKAAKKIKAAANGDKKKKGTGEDDDLAAYNLDTYDEEESKGAGKLFFYPSRLIQKRKRS